MSETTFEKYDIVLNSEVMYVFCNMLMDVMLRVGILGSLNEWKNKNNGSMDSFEVYFGIEKWKNVIFKVLIFLNVMQKKIDEMKSNVDTVCVDYNGEIFASGKKIMNNFFKSKENAIVFLIVGIKSIRLLNEKQNLNELYCDLLESHVSVSKNEGDYINASKCIMYEKQFVDIILNTKLFTIIDMDEKNIYNVM